MTSDDIPIVGGKNASLGEIIRELVKQGVRIPDGFAVTAQAFCERIGHGTVRIVHGVDELHEFQDGDVLVSDITDPFSSLFSGITDLWDNRNGRISPRNVEIIVQLAFCGRHVE